VSRELLSTAERFRRASRDAAAHRLRSLTRRSQGALFERYARVIPHVFLRVGSCAVAPLRRDRAEVRGRLRERAVWTLDTAARLRGGIGLVRSGDLHAYLSEPDLAWAVHEGLVGAPTTAGLCLDPPYPRDPVLLGHLTDTPPPMEIVAGGQRVVERGRLIRDLFGTLGFRPDLLARLESEGQ